LPNNTYLPVLSLFPVTGKKKLDYVPKSFQGEGSPCPPITIVKVVLLLSVFDMSAGAEAAALKCRIL
jgi:hypothetical protein